MEPDELQADGVEAEAVEPSGDEVHVEAVATVDEVHVELAATDAGEPEGEPVEHHAEPIYVVEGADEHGWPQGSMRMAAVDLLIDLEPAAEEPAVDAHAATVPEVLEETGAAATREPTQE